MSKGRRQSEDKSLGSLREETNEIETLERAIGGKIQSISNRVSKIDGPLNRVVSDLQSMLDKLEVYQTESREIRVRLLNKGSLTMDELELFDGKLLKIEEEVGRYKSLLDPRKRTEEEKPQIEATRVGPKTPEFRARDDTRRSGSFLFKDYDIFGRLDTEENLRSYSLLLKLRSLKIRILEEISDGVYDVQIISKKLDVDSDRVEKGLAQLVEFGHVSDDKRILSDSMKQAVLLYRFIKERAKEDSNFAALAIYPLIVTHKGRPIGTIEQYTGLEKRIIEDGAILLEEQHLISRRTGTGSVVYAGNTEHSQRLFMSISPTYTQDSRVRG